MRGADATTPRRHSLGLAHCGRATPLPSRPALPLRGAQPVLVMTAGASCATFAPPRAGVRDRQGEPRARGRRHRQRRRSGPARHQERPHRGAVAERGRSRPHPMRRSRAGHWRSRSVPTIATRKRPSRALVADGDFDGPTSDDVPSGVHTSGGRELMAKAPVQFASSCRERAFHTGNVGYSLRTQTFMASAGRGEHRFSGWGA